MINADVTIKGSAEGNVLARDVDFNGRGEVVSGDIIADRNVVIRGGGMVFGNIHAGGQVDIGSGGATEVHGNIYARSDIRIQGTVFGEIHSCEGNISFDGKGSSGSARAAGSISGARIDGDADAGGKISGTVSGTARAHGTMSGNIGTIDQDTPPRPPTCPDPYTLGEMDLEAPTDFSAGGHGGPNIRKSTDVPLPPGSYGTVVLGSNAALHLQGGTYYFDSVQIGGRTSLYLDLSVRDIQIFVTDTVSLANILIYVSEDGEAYHPAHPAGEHVDYELAAKVFMEIHGTGTAFSMHNEGQWFGAVYTPYGLLDVGVGAQLIGGYYSGAGHNISNFNELTHVPPNYWANRR